MKSYFGSDIAKGNRKAVILQICAWPGRLLKRHIPDSVLGSGGQKGVLISTQVKLVHGIKRLYFEEHRIKGTLQKKVS